MLLRMLERVPLAIRLAALIAVPLLVIVAESAARLHDFGIDHSEAVSFGEQADEVAAIDQAIRRVQIERDLSVQLFTLPEGDAAREELLTAIDVARAESRAAIAAAGLSESIPLDELSREPERASEPVAPRGAAPGGGSGSSDSGGIGGGEPARNPTSAGRPLPSIPGTLSELRELGEGRNVTASFVADLYTDLITEYQGELMAAAGIDEGTVPASYLVSYQNVVLATEQFAQLRARGLVLLADDDPNAAELRVLGQTNDQEHFFLDQAEGTAQPAQQQILRELLGVPTVASFEEVKRAILQVRGANDDVSREVWLSRTEVRLAALMGVTDAFLAELLAQVEASVSEAQQRYAQIFTRSVLVVLAVAVGAWLVTRSISGPLRRLSVAARNASVGLLTEVDAPPSRDAIGEIGRAYDELNVYMHEVSAAAEGIARGDLAREIRPRSSDDRLGTALQTMTRQLSSMVSRSHRRSRELAETVGELRETVSRDALTGLVSRSRFEELLAEQVAESRPIGRAFGVLFIDLDGFKPVNDTLGHDAGDALLREVARRLTSSVRDHDTVARLGGDEFTVLLNDPRDLDALRMTARRVVETVRIPYAIDGEEVRIGASVGLARYPDHGASAEELLRASDRAMYEAKHSGGGDARTAEPDEAA